jgi:hypothetical protein
MKEQYLILCMEIQIGNTHQSDMCIAWLGRSCSELVEGLPTGFRLELAKRVLLKSYFEI